MIRLEFPGAPIVLGQFGILLRQTLISGSGYYYHAGIPERFDLFYKRRIFRMEFSQTGTQRNIYNPDMIAVLIG